MTEPTSTSEAGWKTPEEIETEIDFTKPPPTDEEMGWKPSSNDFFDYADPDPPDGSGRLERSDDPAMSKKWTTALRSGWKEAPSRPATLTKSTAQLVGLRDFNDFAAVHEKPPESHVDTQTDTTVVTRSADDVCEALPPDPLNETNTDVAQVLKVPYTFVDSTESVTSMLDTLATFESEEPLLSIDLEGLDLGKKKGEIHLIQIYDSFCPHVYTIDVCTLGGAAFSTPARTSTMTLGMVLESSCVLKLFCDVRGDSLALFKDFKVHLRGVKDIQNIELASRRDPTRREWRNGLSRLID